MVRFCLFLILLASSSIGYSQSVIPNTNNEHINLPVYLIELEQVSGRDSIIHIDSTNGFQVTIPKWWRIKETPPYFFGGIFPAIDGIENALIFKFFKKDKFKDLADFENWVIKDYSLGQSPKWSAGQTILLKKEIPDFKEVGNAYKTQLINEGKIYDCCYIIGSTSTSYVWIDFTATSTTYSKNFDKFKEIVGLFKKI